MRFNEFDRYGEHYKIFHNTTDEAISIVLNEVFDEECYKKGLDWIKKIKNPTVVDIGGFVGDTALYFSRHKGTKIYVAEPCKENFDCLLRTVDGMDNITVANLGILNECKQVKLDLGNTEGSGGESVYNSSDNSEEITVVDIKTFMDKLNIKHIDLLKIDIEGAEYEVLGGPFFEKINKNVDAIIGETHLTPALPYIIEPMLKEYGYKFEWIPYKNLHYMWNMNYGKWHKRVETHFPTLFFAHR